MYLTLTSVNCSSTKESLDAEWIALNCWCSTLSPYFICLGFISNWCSSLPRKYSESSNRKDLIHLNRKGLMLVREELSRLI